MKVEAKVLSENNEATEKAQQKIKALTGSKLKTKQTKVKRQSSCSTVIVSATELTVLISQNPKSRKIKVKINYTVVATSTCISVKPAISPPNVAQNTNSGTVLDSARPEDSKTPPTC